MPSAPAPPAVGASSSTSALVAAGSSASSPRPSLSWEGELSDSDKQRTISKEIEESHQRPLRTSSRRPSVPTAAPRLQQRELSIAHHGWLIKHSRGGAPNHHRRWFILIGGSLYYARNGSHAAGSIDGAPGPLQIFAELEHAQGVEMVEMDNFAHAFRILFPDAPPMLFAGPSAADRLKWLAVLEAHLGMQPVPLQVLQRQLKREEEDGTAALRVATLSAELADSQSEVRQLRELVAQLQGALTAKDDQLWKLVAERDPSVIGALNGRAEPAQPTGKNRSVFRVGTREPKTPTRAPQLLTHGGSAAPTPVPNLELTSGRLQAFDAPGAAPSGALSDRSEQAPSDGSTSRSMFKGRFFQRKNKPTTERSAPAAASGPNTPPQGPFCVASQSAPQPPLVTKASSMSMSSGSFTSYGGAHAQPREYPMSDRGYAPSYAPSERPERGLRPRGASTQLSVKRYGHLTKLSRGGFTMNWNRRAFVLIGSTLFYERDYDTLAVTPKVFAQLNPFCEIISWAAGSSPHNHVFAIKYEDDAEKEVLQLAADTAIEKFAWMEALSAARNDPHCPSGRVAPLMSMLALESTQRNVLQTQIEDAMMQAAGGPVGGSYRASCRSVKSTGAPDLLQRNQRRSERDASPGMSWFLDRIVPDIFKNL